MSTLPPGVPEAPQPAGNEPEGASDTPRWATPVVPPPWAGADQPATPTSAPTDAQPEATPPWAQPSQAAPQPQPAPQPEATPWARPSQPAPQPQPAWQPQPSQPARQPGFGYPATAPRQTFDRAKWLPTVAVAALIAGVVLGGIGLDKVVAAPSVGTVQIGANASLKAAPGWALVDSGPDGVTLQKANVRFFAAAQPYERTAHEMLLEVEDGLRSEVDQITFGSENDGMLAGHDAAMIGFEAINSGSSGTTVDGEAICIIVRPDGVLLEAVAPVGMLDSAADDIKAMAASIEVGQ